MRSFLLTLWAFMTFFSLLRAEGGFSYSYLPKYVHPHQVFPVTILDTTEWDETPVFSLSDAQVRPIIDTPLLIRNGKERFYTFYYQAPEEVSVVLPRVLITLGERKFLLDAVSVPIRALPAPPKDFCGVLATQLKVKNYQVSHFDEKHYLATLSVEAYEANLDEIKLPGFAQQGTENFKRHHAKATIELYVVLPAQKQTIRFSYYNTLKKHFEEISVPIDLIDMRVAGQSELNPKENDFDKLKKYFFMGLTALFVLLFLLYRDLFYLALAAVAFVTLLTFYVPHKRICIEEGAPLYILPTENANISMRIPKKFETSLLGTRRDFYKIEYKKGIVGWVKNENLCKN